MSTTRRGPRTVIVTGAGQGIGATYARALAEAGWHVVVNDVVADLAHAIADDITASDGLATAHPADVSDWDAAASLVASAHEVSGSIDGLVNNAGVIHLAHLHEETDAAVRRAFEVNVLGTIACSTHAVRRMRAQGRGAIVNVVSGSQSGMRALGTYGATKGAIASLTYTWALELLDDGIRVNAISPNAHTSMADVFAEYFGARAERSNQHLAPEMNAPAVVWLLSDRATVTGQVLRVDGEDLSITSHPRRLEPIARGGAVTPDAVDAAVRGTLAPNLQDLGLGRID